MRTIITAFVLLIYVILFNLYLYELTLGTLSYRRTKLLYYYITLGMLLFFLIDNKIGIRSFLHEQFNILCIISVIFNYIIAILCYHKILYNPMTVFVSFNGGILIATIMVLISGGRHGIFKD